MCFCVHYSVVNAFNIYRALVDTQHFSVDQFCSDSASLVYLSDPLQLDVFVITHQTFSSTHWVKCGFSKTYICGSGRRMQSRSLSAHSCELHSLMSTRWMSYVALSMPWFDYFAFMLTCLWLLGYCCVMLVFNMVFNVFLMVWCDMWLYFNSYIFNA